MCPILALSALLAAPLLPSQQPPSQPPVVDRSTVPFCPVSDDPKYGFTPGAPVATGVVVQVRFK